MSSEVARQSNYQKMKKLTGRRRDLKMLGYFSTQEAADHGHVSRQAIYSAIRAGRLSATKVGKTLYILRSDYDEYRMTRYNPMRRSAGGMRLIDFEAGQYTVQVAAKIMAELTNQPFPSSKLYNLIYAGYIRAYRYGKAWVLMKEDIERYIKFGRQQSDNQLKLITYQG
jgi:excisionase family DNA binding protein